MIRKYNQAVLKKPEQKAGAKKRAADIDFWFRKMKTDRKIDRRVEKIDS